MGAREVVVEIRPPRKRKGRVKIVAWIPQELIRDLVTITVTPPGKEES